MTVLALIGVGALLIAVGLLLLPLAYALWGDEMPDWAGDWGPFIGMFLSLLGSVSIFAGITLGVIS